MNIKFELNIIGAPKILNRTQKPQTTRRIRRRAGECGDDANYVVYATIPRPILEYYK